MEGEGGESGNFCSHTRHAVFPSYLPIPGLTHMNGRIATRVNTLHMCAIICMWQGRGGGLTKEFRCCGLLSKGGGGRSALIDTMHVCALLRAWIYMVSVQFIQIF